MHLQNVCNLTWKKINSEQKISFGCDLILWAECHKRCYGQRYSRKVHTYYHGDYLGSYSGPWKLRVALTLVKTTLIHARSTVHSNYLVISKCVNEKNETNKNEKHNQFNCRIYFI